MIIDPNFDFRSEIKSGQDPDSHSPTLRRFHQFLWSKPLPTDDDLRLRIDKRRQYLAATVGAVDMTLSSDAIAHSFLTTKTLEKIVAGVEAQRRHEILCRLRTIGGYIVFPANRVDGKMTINGARGCNNRICDRFDLTLECVRRYYCEEKSPLSEVLSRYRFFFDLFVNFRGYVDFFLLRDLVENEAVKFFMPFDDKFPARPFPRDLAEYESYISNVMKFVTLRGKRMREWCEGFQTPTSSRVSAE
jgi:hypothetical protein